MFKRLSTIATNLQEHERSITETRPMAGLEYLGVGCLLPTEYRLFGAFVSGRLFAPPFAPPSTQLAITFVTRENHIAPVKAVYYMGHDGEIAINTSAYEEPRHLQALARTLGHTIFKPALPLSILRMKALECEPPISDLECIADFAENLSNAPAALRKGDGPGSMAQIIWLDQPLLDLTA